MKRSSVPGKCWQTRSLLTPMAQDPFPLSMSVVPAPMGLHPLLGAKRANGFHVLHPIYRFYWPDRSYSLDILHLSPLSLGEHPEGDLAMAENYVCTRTGPGTHRQNEPFQVTDARTDIAKRSVRQLGCQLLHASPSPRKMSRPIGEAAAVAGFKGGGACELLLILIPTPPPPLEPSGNPRTPPGPWEPSPAPISPWPSPAMAR